MRTFGRVLSTSVTALAFTAAGLAIAAPAAAGPGEGCAGLPEMPAAYVCVVTLNPGALVPGTEPAPVPVRVPPVCYVAGCTQATTVNVPLVSATPGSGNAAVLYYDGTYYPIGLGLDVVWPVVEDVQILAGNVVGIVNDAVDDVPTTGEVLAAIHGVVDPIVAEQVEELEYTIERYRDAVERLPEALPRLFERINEIIQNVLDNVCFKC